MTEDDNKVKSRVDRMEQIVQILKTLAEGQADTDRRLKELIEIVREGRG